MQDDSTEKPSDNFDQSPSFSNSDFEPSPSDQESHTYTHSFEPEIKPPPSRSRLKLLFIAFFLVLLITGSYFLYTTILKNQSETPDKSLTTTSQPSSSVPSINKFVSDDEFKEYVNESKSYVGTYSGLSGIGSSIGSPSLEVNRSIDVQEDASFAPVAGGGIQRYSETNVQVKEIDEPDIVKTDGSDIYISYKYAGIRPLPEPVLLEQGTRAMPIYKAPETSIINAFPPADIHKKASINETGEMLLNGNNLIFFAGNKIIGYDVASPETPVQSWELELENTSSIVASRLYSDKVFLVTQTHVSSSSPCPIPLLKGSSTMSLPCTDIHRPDTRFPADSTFTIIKIDTSSGAIENKTSIIGTASSSVLYMSPNYIYLTYSYFDSIFDILFDFFETSVSDLYPQEIIDTTAKLNLYDISVEAKIFELGNVIESYHNTLTDEAKTHIQDELETRMETYLKERTRDLENTEIIKITTDTFSITASGSVPGVPLNQFSIDEYQGNLRIATTIGGSFFGSMESINDIYVLSPDLNILGSIKDLGLTERIYAARFIADRGYIVTFRQIDPFYVLDLSDPANPQRKGELKIPGYSSYLHPLSDNTILGVGKEGSKVKLSLFNVSDPYNPSEVAKHSLDEYWSDILNTHHAFLLDGENSIFFMPGGSSGYIFSYTDSQLTLVKKAENIQAKRAIFINNYLYVIGQNNIVVLSIGDWTEVNKLTF